MTLVSRILTWFDANERDLPWRAPGTSAWAILLSEVMSQQTPVARVSPLWHEWVQRWPTPAHLAQAAPSDVLRAWANLGYPRRALRLRECAIAITERFDGQVPDSVDDLLSLPGIGDYTARAVACFAFGKNVAVVDTNVRRVVARAIDATFIQPPARARDIARVTALLPRNNGPRFSAGLMELGALVCTSRSPQCQACPIRDLCAWQLAGCPEPTAEELQASAKRVQKFAGTDRQVRGAIMRLLRTSTSAVSFTTLDTAWPATPQRARALASLLDDGLACSPQPGYYTLPRE